MNYTTLTVRDCISSMKPAALVLANGDNVQILDGLDGEALRGMARVLLRAADHSDEYNATFASHGASSFSIGYEVEWDSETKAWPSDNFSRKGEEISAISKDSRRPDND
tara:strand:+ start:49 stop:375 length:327 start_codon:yes stop_codon:yes gene_type:complete